MDAMLMCTFEDNVDIEGWPDFIQHLWKGDWPTVMDSDIFFQHSNETDAKTIILEYIKKNNTNEEHSKIFSVGISLIYAFCEINWTGPNAELSKELCDKFSQYYDVTAEVLKNEEEINPTILCPELLFIACEIFNGLSKECENKLVAFWWQLRCYVLYQMILDENSPRIYSILENALNNLSNLEQMLVDSPQLQALLNVEMSQAHLLYGRVQDSESRLKSAKEISGLNLTLKGALGKRTKFQQEAIAQLTVDVEVNELFHRVSSKLTHNSSNLLNELKHNDDVRLENIQYTDIKENMNIHLTSLEQQICLATVQYMQRAQPKDELADEELYPFINLLLAQESGPWATRVSAFLMKCKMESRNKRTVERSMMQCEEIVNNFKNPLPKVTSRLSYLWASALPPVLSWRSLLADLFLSIGLVKAALDLYLQLQLWEEVIACYTVLELRHKAAEIIQQQIEIKPTVKLYCLLGDATDDVEQYKKAWNFSHHKSSRAQRHWGNYLFSHKKYEECIPHYQRSCEINSLQESVWLRLGYAALTVECWELAATAYRRYTYLEPHSFEAWNNLAKVYVKQGNKTRAYKALSEALKFNYDNWQVWDNMLVVSIDTGHFDDVVRSYHRLLDLRAKHLDLDVLALLVRALLQDSVDYEGNHIKRITPKVLELFGRITSAHPNDASLWQLYADISPNSLLKGQRLLKSYNSIIKQDTWVSDLKLSEDVLNVVETLAVNSLGSISDANESDKSQVWQLVSSARLTTQAVIRAISNQQYEQFNDKICILQEYLEKLTSELKNR